MYSPHLSTTLTQEPNMISRATLEYATKCIAEIRAELANRHVYTPKAR